MRKKKFYIITTVPISLIFYKGQISYLKRYFEVYIISSSGDLFNNTLNEENINGFNVEMKREISILNDFRSLFNLIMLFFKTKPDIIHASTPKAGLLSMIAGWIMRVPTRIYYIHGLRYEGAKGFKRKILKFFEKLSCFFATDIYAVSYGVKETLNKDAVTTKKVNIIGEGSVNGINMEYFSTTNLDIPNLKKNYNITEKNFIYGFVGRLVSNKGINELIYAFKEININYPNTKLLLVGNYEHKLDPLENNTLDIIANHPNIIHVGFQKDIRPFLKMMNVFVFPSYREGFGVSIIEALSMEIPVISSDITGCNEIINSTNGILIPAKSSIYLKKAMIDLLINPSKYKQLKTHTRKSIINKFNQNLVWKNTLEEYKKITS